MPYQLDIECQSEDLSLLNDLPQLGFAVIGSRIPQRRSFELLERTFADLRGTGLIIISGLARGIDSRAHELALEHGLKTIGVLGNGIDIDYPRENRHLRRKIIEAGGMVISPFDRGTQPYKSNFIHRNQLIAGFAKAVWVVEAAAISGTLNTANHATKFNRDLYATPSFPDDPFFQGNQKLLSQISTENYPLAHAFHNVQSLGMTWFQLGAAKKSQSQADLFEPQSQIQKWVIEIKSEYGECLVQALMNRAAASGLTLGKFYLQYESEIEAGCISQDFQGRVEVITSMSN